VESIKTFQLINLSSYSITTSPEAVRSASLISSSEITSLREDVEEESSFENLNIGEIERMNKTEYLFLKTISNTMCIT